MGGGAGNASIQVRNGVFTVLSIALCLGFPTKQMGHEHHEKPNCSSTDKNTKEQKNLLLSSSELQATRFGPKITYLFYNLVKKKWTTLEFIPGSN